MAYRDPTFNANILTDLLSTYLQQKSNERDRYFKAEQQANKPQYRTVDGNLVEIGRGGQVRTLISKQKEEKEPKFEDFAKDGMINKGQFMGRNYVQSSRDKKFGMPEFYKFTGSSRPQFKPEDKDKRKRQIEDKDISRMVSDRNTLLRRKNKNYDVTDLMMIEKGMIPKDFTNEDQQRLDDIEKKLVKKGFDIFGQEKMLNDSSAPKVSKGSFWED